MQNLVAENRRTLYVSKLPKDFDEQGVYEFFK